MRKFNLIGHAINGGLVGFLAVEAGFGLGAVMMAIGVVVFANGLIGSGE